MWRAGPAHRGAHGQRVESSFNSRCTYLLKHRQFAEGLRTIEDLVSQAAKVTNVAPGRIAGFTAGAWEKTPPVLDAPELPTPYIEKT